MAFDLKLDNGRLILADNGDAEVLTGTDKLIQDILRELTLPQGDDIFDTSRGSALNKDIVGMPLNPDVILPRIESSIIRTLEAFKERQELYATRQFFSDAEILAEINDVSVAMNEIDPRQIDITIDVSSLALTPISISFTFQVF